MSQTYSLEIEKQVLSGFMNNPMSYFEVEKFLDFTDFYSRLNGTIFSILKNFIENNKNIDPVMIGQNIKNLGITFEDDIDIFDYLDALKLIQTSAQSTIAAVRELKKLSIARELIETAQKMASSIKSKLNESVETIIAEADKIYNDKVNLYNFSDAPIDIFSQLEDEVEERGNNPKVETGFITPYSYFNNRYGGIRKGNVYAFCSRAGHGKSTILNHLCYTMTQLNPGLKTLILDTEMETVDIMLRMAASFSNVPHWYVDTGNWRKNPEMFQKMRSALKEIEKYKGKVFHLYVGGKPINEVIPMIKRWYFSEVGRGNDAIVAYDYIKLTGETLSDFRKENQVIGEKIDKLKQLTIELDIPLLTACQLNRSGEQGHQGKIVDDSSAIAQSDRLQWFGSFVGLFRHKSPEEIQEDGIQFGTHKLIPVKTRFQGREAPGHNDLVRITEGTKIKYKANYINFNVDNFRVEERGSLRHIIEAQNAQITPTNGSSGSELL